jgi:TrmH family RNA methyltransferase
MRMNEKNLAYSEKVVDPRSTLSAHPTTFVREDPGVVDSLLHPLAILIRQVLTRSGRMDLNLILIDDEENIIQALDAGIEIHSLYYSGGAVLSEELMRKLPLHTKVYEIARRTCKKIFENEKVTRVFAIAHTPAIHDLGYLLKIPRDIVALEDLTISGNIGAIIRTSLAFGAGGIVLLNTNPVDIYDRRLIRASRGHVFSLPILTATTEEFIRCCAENKLPILVMDPHARLTVDDAATFRRVIVIALGSEKDGCSQTLKDAATLQVQIPIHSRVESLNVSTAAGIMLYKRLWFNHLQAGK